MKNRYLFWFCSSYILAAIFSAVFDTFLAGTAAIGAFALVAVFFLGKSGAKASAALVVVGIAFSLIWQSVYFSSDKINPSLLGGEVTLDATVVSFPEETSTGGVSFRAKIPEEDIKVIVYSADSGSALLPGDKIVLRASVYEYKNTADYAEKTYYKSRYIDARAYAYSIERVGEVPNARVVYMHEYLSYAMKERIDLLFEADSAAFVRSLVLGDTSDLSKDFKEDLRRTGMSHAVSVSGMHISFLMGFVYLFTKNRYLKLLAIPVMFLFAFMVGAPQSALRAVIMQSLLLISSVKKREYDSLTALSFAAFVLAFVNPYCVTDVGFLLSFAATLGIVVLNKPLFEGFSGVGRKVSGFPKKVFAAVFSILSLSISATLFTTPITAYSFNSVSLIAPLSNLLLNFVIMLVFMGSIVALVLSFIYLPIGEGVAGVLEMITNFISKVIKMLSSLSFAEVFTGSPVVILTVAFLCFVAVYAILAGKKRIRRGFALLTIFVVLITLPILNFALPKDTHEGVRFDVLDVGQGQCIVVTYGDECAVIDCGGDEGAENVAISHLLSRGITDIDALVLTHGHADHVNGALYLTEKIDTKAVYMPSSDRNNATFVRISDAVGEERAVFVGEDTKVSLSDVEISLLTLPAGKDENENGLVVLVRDGDYELLVTGDIPAKLEADVIDRIPDCESYVLGHHGSKTSSSQALLNRALPELCLVSVGEGNSYGHPDEATLARVEKLNSEIHRTDIEGTITFYSK